MRAVFHDPANAEKTLELLWASIRARGDLPGFSKVVNSIIGAMNGESDKEFNMTKTVLSDPALTQRVLRLANSAMYSVFGAGINTVSKAVTVLGTESIGHLALGLKLIDGLSGAVSDSPGTRNELEKAVLSGHIGRQVASSANSRDVEEVVVCSMLHTLGRLMVTFYLPSLWLKIQTTASAETKSEVEVAPEVLGLGLDDIGRVIAKQWGFPPSLVNSMAHVQPKAVTEPISHEEWLATVSSMSSHCAEIICRDEVADTAALSRLIGSYTDMLGLEAEQILAAVDAALQMVEDEAVIARTVKLPGTIRKEPEKSPIGGKPADSVQLLKRGVSDLREAINFSSAKQLLSIALETVYQGLGFTRTIAFVRNSDRHQYVVRLGFGEGIADMLDKLWFPDAYQPDVFHAALANDKMIFVENAHLPGFASKLPRWWKGSLADARSFMVLPLTINRNPMGFIYGDWNSSLPPSKIDAAEIAPLNELHTLLVNVIEQRRSRDQISSKDIF